MAPKKKEKGKKKKGLKGDGSTIAAGITPSASFVATPRTTPPPPGDFVQKPDLGLSQGTGVLSSSILGHMFRTPPPTMVSVRGTGGGDITAEDTDTSLYDYELGKGTMQPRIGQALMPPVVFTAVPRVPPPVLESSRYGIGLTTSLLNTSLLPRLFATPVPALDEGFLDDNDSSDLDYERAEDITVSPVRRKVTGNKVKSRYDVKLESPKSARPGKRNLTEYNEEVAKEGDNGEEVIGSVTYRVTDSRAGVSMIEQERVKTKRGKAKRQVKDNPVRSDTAEVRSRSNDLQGSRSNAFEGPRGQEDAAEEEFDNELHDVERYVGNTVGESGYDELEVVRVSRQSSIIDSDGTILTLSDQDRGTLGQDPIYELERPGTSGNRGSDYGVLDDSGTLVSETGEPLYSQPRKFRRGSQTMQNDSLPGSSSMRHFNEEDAASLRRSQRGRGSKRSRRSSTRSIEERIESIMVDKQHASGPSPGPPRRGPSPGPRTTGSMSGRDSYGYSASPRLRTLRTQNEELIQKQIHLEEQLKEQQLQQKNLMDRLVQKGLLASQDEDTVSLLHQTQSMTDRSIRKQDELVQALQERTRVLEEEKRELQELNDQLQVENYSFKKMGSARESGEGLGDETARRKQLQDECTTLKSTVHRLNVELSRYQAKFRPLKPQELKEEVGLPGKGPKPAWLIDTKYLAPLFVAYDDRLQEKDENLNELQEELEVIKQNIEDVIRENQRLHLRMEQTDAVGPISMTEWRQLQEQCKLVVEENQLLMEQLDLQQNKARDMHRAHVHEVTRMSKLLTSTESEKRSLEVGMEVVQEKLVDIQDKSGSNFAGSLEEQFTAISKLKTNLEKEKSKHSQETENLLTKLKLVSADKKSREVEVENLRSENRQLEGEIKALHRAQRKSHRKVLLLQTALTESEVQEKSSEKYLKSVVRLAEQTVKERDLLAQSAEDKDWEKKHAISQLLEGSVSNKKMEEKLKIYKAKAEQKLQRAALRMKDQDDDFNVQRQEYKREILHLRGLLSEREQLLEGVVGEKKQVEADLETMWQVAAHDNREMKETMRKSVRKLKEHESLRRRVDVGDEEYLLTCTEDEFEN